MATESIGTARVDIVVNTDQFDVAITSAKRSVADMSTAAQQQYAQLSAAEKRRIASLIKQADTLGFTRDQQIAYNAALKTEGPLLDEITRRLRTQQSAAKGAAVEFNKFGISQKQTSAAMRGVPAQITDIFTSLQGGQAPLTVLLQQGGQLKDMFGGIAPAARALGTGLLGLINPLTLTAAAIAGIVVAYEQGAGQQRAFESALTLTGGYAGVTADELARLAKELDGLTGTTTAEAAAALAQVAGTGQFTASQIELVTTAALQMRAATGKAIEDTVSEFEKLRKDPVAAILELNDKYHFLTQAQFENINSLKEQGRETDAAAAAFAAYAGSISERTPQLVSNFGLVQSSLSGIKNIAAEAWDAVVQGIANADRAALNFVRNNSKASALALSALPGANLLGYTGIDALLKGATQKPKAAAASRATGTPFDARAAQKVSEDKKKAEEEFARLSESNLSKRGKLEAEITKIRALGAKAGLEDVQIEKQVAAARARYAESLPKGAKAKKPREQVDPTDALLNRIKQQIALNEEQGKSEDALTASERLRVQVLAEIERLGGKVTAGRRAEIDTLLEQAIASDKAAVAFKAEVKAKEDLSRLNAELAVTEANQARENSLDLMQYGRGSDAVEQLRRQLDIREEYEDEVARLVDRGYKVGTESYKLQEDALRESLDRRLEAEDEYQAARAEKMADWKNGASAAFEDFSANAENVAGQTYDFFSNTLDGLADATSAYATGTKGAFDSLLDDLYAQSIKFLAQQAIKNLIAAFGGGSASGSGGGEMGSLASLFTGDWGYAKGGMVGYATGGFTGAGGRNDPAGIVHRGEYVINADATRALGRGVLDRLNTGQMPSRGSDVSITQQIVVSGRPDSRTANQIAAESARAARVAVARNG